MRANITLLTTLYFVCWEHQLQAPGIHTQINQHPHPTLQPGVLPSPCDGPCPAVHAQPQIYPDDDGMEDAADLHEVGDHHRPMCSNVWLPVHRRVLRIRVQPPVRLRVRAQMPMLLTPIPTRPPPLVPRHCIMSVNDVLVGVGGADVG